MKPQTETSCSHHYNVQQQEWMHIVRDYIVGSIGLQNADIWRGQSWQVSANSDPSCGLNRANTYMQTQA